MVNVVSKYDNELKTINLVVKELVKELLMDDWNITIKYSPDVKPDDNTIADVKIEAVYKSACIIVYEIRHGQLKTDLRHELLHCKLGLIKESYESAIDGLVELLKVSLQKNEELVVESFNKFLSAPEKMSLGEQKNGKNKQVKIQT